MATLISGYITAEKLEKILNTIRSKGEKGFKFNVSVNDETNEHGNNASFYAEQTKEQREAKAPKFYFGNGKVFWTNGTISVATKAEPTAPTPSAKKDDLPF